MSVTARLNRLRDAAGGVARTTLRAATPVVSATAARVRARLHGRTPQPGPTGATPPPDAADAPVPPVPSGRSGAPSPASVARNVAPHPPAAPATTPKPPRPSAPGAKLPPRRRTDED